MTPYNTADTVVSCVYVSDETASSLVGSSLFICACVCVYVCYVMLCCVMYVRTHARLIGVRADAVSTGFVAGGIRCANLGRKTMIDSNPRYASALSSMHGSSRTPLCLWRLFCFSWYELYCRRHLAGLLRMLPYFF